MPLNLKKTVQFLFIPFIINALNNSRLVAQTQPSTWILNPNASRITFAISNLGITVPGTISGLKIETNFNPKNLETSYLRGSAETKTLFTDNEDRDEHIKKDDFFDVKNFPLARIETKKIYKTKNAYAAITVLEIKGIKKEYKIPFAIAKQKKSIIITSEFEINRMDFAIGEEGVILSNEVKIKIHLTLNQ